MVTCTSWFVFLELDFKQTIGVDQDVWYYSISHDDPYRGDNEERRITFYTWDFAGQVRKLNVLSLLPSTYIQEEYYATHQCYLTGKALYILCWRVTDGINGVVELKEWLLSIQVSHSCIFLLVFKPLHLIGKS